MLQIKNEDKKNIINKLKHMMREEDTKSRLFWKAMRKIMEQPPLHRELQSTV